MFSDLETSQITLLDLRTQGGIRTGLSSAYCIALPTAIKNYLYTTGSQIGTAYFYELY